MLDTLGLSKLFLNSTFLSFIVAALWVIPLIGLLYRLQFTAKHILTKNKVNEEFIRLHKHKSGTPSMGGILIWLTAPVIMWLMAPHTKETITIVISFLLLGFVGLIDGTLDMVTKHNKKVRALQNTFGWRLAKIGLIYLVHLIIGFLIYSYLGIKEIVIWPGFSLSFGILTPFILAWVSFWAVYATEIIDGLDGLSSGLFIIVMAGFLILFLNKPELAILGDTNSLVTIVGACFGVMIVYLYFNIPPARFFMGGPGAMPMGFLFLILALLTQNLIPYLIMMLLFIVDMASSIIQIISMKFFDKKVFKIAPLHHDLEAIGWPEYKVVMRFWLFQLVLVLMGLYIGIFWL